MKWRARMAVVAAETVTSQILTGLLLSGLGLVYAGIKVVALPINIAEALWSPDEWTPPW